ncbi:unnamed protein product [Trifolium pratense]|uniref:Uncharacterized protein n=1 Tax=Trifolium pratense TaxID=57577 RepID=A0ACB0ISL7_TRIPR|nr:unnamed protein product [Trifolium pratense]
MNIPLSYFSELKPGRVNWRVEARVIRIWTVGSVLVNGKVNTMELILLDQEGKQIQASVPTHCLQKFAPILREYNVYVISSFNVSRNLDCGIGVFSEYNISFNEKTEIYFSNCLLIKRSGLSLLSSSEVLTSSISHRYYVDVIGMLTALHYEVFLDFNGNMKTVVKLQLSDRRGRFDCELRGSSVTQFQSLFNNCYEGLPIVMLQFARVKMDKGYVFVESVDDVTRVLVDPHIAELISFKMGFKKKFSRCYIRSIAVKMKMIEKNYRLFDQCYPVKTLYDLVKSPVYGLFVTFAEMVEITNYDDWFYAVCDCQRNLIKYNSSFYCTECHRTSFRVSPKRKVEFVVGDSTGKAIFTAFDELITGCVSTRGNKMGLNKKDSYNSYSNFLGKNYLYVVRKTHGPNILLPDVFEVVEMTSDLTIIQSFLSKGSSYTPTKCIFKPSFSEIVPVGFDIIGTSNLGCCQGPSVVPVLQGFARSDCRLTAGEPIVAKRNLCHILEGVPLKKSRGI